MYCPSCGQNLSLDHENGGLEQFYCDKCDILYSKDNETINYIKNATYILNQVLNDLELMKKNNL